MQHVLICQLNDDEVDILDLPPNPLQSLTSTSFPIPPSASGNSRQPFSFLDLDENIPVFSLGMARTTKSSNTNKASSSLFRLRLGVVGRELSVPAVDDALEGDRYTPGRLGEGEKADGDIRSEPEREGALEQTDETEKEDARDVEGESKLSQGELADEIEEETELLEDVIMLGKLLG